MGISELIDKANVISMLNRNEGREVTANIIDILAARLAVADKYRWHDLRKNPDDLPHKEGKYTVLLDDEPQAEINYEYRTRYYQKGEWFCEEYLEHNELEGCPREWYLDEIDGTVIAWREIEPFEVSE